MAQHAATTRLLLPQIPGELVFGLASQLVLLLLAGTTVLLTVQGTLTVPEAIALIVVLVRYLDPFTSLAPGIEAATGMRERIRAVLDAPADRDGRVSHPPARPPRIELRDVGFRYDDDAAPVLEHLDLVLEARTITAVVGPSGSGKSTVLSLIAGLPRPTTGQVLVDGVDTANRDAQSRRDLVSAVFQQPYLFDATIRKNILVGRPSASAAACNRAAALVRVDTILERLPEGWDTRVGEAGGSLSDGERQRVSIARALLDPAPVLLVDEAAVTASLTDDPHERTRIVVASIRAADRVVFLDEGRIVEDGTVDQLLAAGGRFAEFWHEKDAAGTWRLGAGDRT